jgi:hypothetical protein
LPDSTEAPTVSEIRLHDPGRHEGSSFRNACGGDARWRRAGAPPGHPASSRSARSGVPPRRTQDACARTRSGATGPAREGVAPRCRGCTNPLATAERGRNATARRTWATARWTYLTSILAPASSSCFLMFAASSLPIPSLSALGVLSTRSLASFRRGR